MGHGDITKQKIEEAIQKAACDIWHTFPISYKDDPGAWLDTMELIQAAVDTVRERVVVRAAKRPFTEADAIKIEEWVWSAFGEVVDAEYDVRFRVIH